MSPTQTAATIGASQLYRQHAMQIKVARIVNTYGPNMLPNDGRVVSSSIVQALRGEPLPSSVTEPRPGRSATWTISSTA